MPYETDDPRSCSIASALDVIGERWTLLVLREVHYGVGRFDQIVKNTGASRDTVTKRLKVLTKEGVLKRQQYSTHPPRYEYVATEMGMELRPVLLLLNAWGARWLPDAPQTPETFVHNCGGIVGNLLTCPQCGRPVTGRDIEIIAPERPY
jgi:DNA-binding HxlR family transcriptional regulator